MLLIIKKIPLKFVAAAAMALLFTSCSSAYRNSATLTPTLNSINIVDRNGMSETISAPDRLEQYNFVDFLQPQAYQKVLRIYARDPAGNIPACITSYHPNGYTHKYLDIINSRAYGCYKEWYPNGNKKMEVDVIEGMGDITTGSEKSWVFDGMGQVWKEGGELEATIPYNKGSLEGIATYYHSNGKIWKILPYHDNKINGVSEIYREDGNLLQRSNYTMGLLEGESVRFWNDGVIASEEFYCDNLLANGTYYTPCGEPIAKIVDGNGTKAIFGKDAIIELRQYVNGLLEGEIQCIDAYGRVTKIYHVKNGTKHGEEATFYEAPRLQKTLTPKLSVTWYEGKVQGTCKSWYDNGTQESQREMSNNKKNGHVTAWYRDGSLMLIEEYEQDKLLRGEYFSKKEKEPVSQIKEGRGIATLYDSEGSFIQKVNYLNGKPVVED